jgi:hypothetical protein
MMSNNLSWILFSMVLCSKEPKEGRLVVSVGQRRFGRMFAFNRKTFSASYCALRRASLE